MALEPPARGISRLRKDRPAATLLYGAGPVVLDLVSLERRGQKLIDRDRAIGRPMGEADAHNSPVARIKERQRDRQQHSSSSRTSQCIPSVPWKVQPEIAHRTCCVAPAFASTQASRPSTVLPAIR